MTESDARTEVKVVRAVKDLGMIKGATGPHIIECDDGKQYLVKFAGPTKAAVNEFVGRALARAVGMPIPEGSLVEVPAEMVAGSRDMQSRGIGPGVHQGTELMQDPLDMDQFVRLVKEGARLSNPEVLPRTICVDNWMLVPDRDRGDNHIIERSDGRLTYIMVDFSHGFTGVNWTADSVEQGSYLRRPVPVHPLVAGTVEGLESFRPTLERIEALGDDEVEMVVASVPERWGLTDEEAACLSGFLEVRRGLLRGILASSNGQFPNWRG